MAYQSILEKVGLNEEKIGILMNAYAETGESELLELADLARKENEVLKAQLRSLLHVTYLRHPGLLDKAVLTGI